jgi:hypothetical protein
MKIILEPLLQSPGKNLLCLTLLAGVRSQMSGMADFGLNSGNLGFACLLNCNKPKVLRDLPREVPSKFMSAIEHKSTSAVEHKSTSTVEHKPTSTTKHKKNSTVEHKSTTGFEHKPTSTVEHKHNSTDSKHQPEPREAANPVTPAALNALVTKYTTCLNGCVAAKKCNADNLNGW